MRLPDTARTRTRSRSAALILMLIAGMLLAACGGGGEASTTGKTPTTSGTTAQGATATSPSATIPSSPRPGETGTPAGQQPTQAADEPTPTTAAPDPGVPTATPQPVELTPEQLQQYKPNELGQVPILEYHQLGPEPEQFIRRPDQLRADLQWLYDHNFQVISLHSFLTDSIDIPAGKRPVILSFDDSSVGQFRLNPLATGQLAIDPDCVIGILEDFFALHPDFGRGGVFAILPNQLFNWPDASDQDEYGTMKVNWLLDNGYELSNHTYNHANLSEISNDEIMTELATWNDFVHGIRPDLQIDAITIPFGMYPAGGDDTLFRGFDYNGQHYEWKAALQVGANPATSVLSTEYDPYALGRIQAFDDELNKWFQIFDENPGILYVSDGNPNTVTVPNDLHAWLVGTLDESKIGDRKLVRY